MAEAEAAVRVADGAEDVDDLWWRLEPRFAPPEVADELGAEAAVAEGAAEGASKGVEYGPAGWSSRLLRDREDLPELLWLLL